MGVGFNAQKVNSSEHDASHFSIEKSTDLLEWANVADIPASGNVFTLEHDGKKETVRFIVQ